VALAVFFLASVAATAVLVRARAQAQPEGAPALPAQAGARKIGIVEQQLYAASQRSRDRLAAQRKELDSYGWVERKSGVIHLPVERAIDLAAQGAMPQGPVVDPALLRGAAP
jgi:hypothetical protein